MEEANHSSMMLTEAAKLPESPRLPMEFLSRSWSLPALQLSKALSTTNSVVVPSSLVPKTVASSCTAASATTPPILEEVDNNSSNTSSGEVDQKNNLQTLKQRLISGPHSFSFASSTTSQLVLERIMSQSEVSPMTSGRPSCSEGISSSLNDHQIDSPPDIPLSPPHDFDYSKFLYFNNTPQPPLPTPRGVSSKNGGGSTSAAGTGSKTVGRWLKDRREKKKEETRVQNAQLHASISVAAVAAAIAATTAATAAASSSSSSKKDEQGAMTDMAMASAATLVAARCVEAAEAMGADHDHLASVISSAVNVQSHGDIMTLTAAAATALRGAATLKARTMKEVCNIAAVLHVEKGFVSKGGDSGSCSTTSSNGDSGGVVGEDFLGLCNEQLLARGSELLKRTRQGDLHWKLVSVYINKEDEVVLKMKSAHMAGTLTKKKKKVLLDVCKDTKPWPERYMVEGGEDRRYFGLKTVSHRVIEFECKNQKEYYLWTQGVSRLLSIAAEKRKNKF